MKTVVRCLLVLFAFCLALCPVLPIPQAEAEETAPRPDGAGRTPVRVAYFRDGAYLYKDTDGSYRGYEAEYIYNIGQHAGWDISFVDCSAFTEVLDGLRNGTIDMALGLSKTEEREEIFLFTDMEIGSDYNSIIVRKDEDRYPYGATEKFSSMHFGMLEGAFVNSYFDRLSRADGFEIKRTYFPTYEAAYDALKAKRIDAVVVGGGMNDEYRTILRFMPRPYYLAITKSRPDLKRQADRAMDEIHIENTMYGKDLYNRYFQRTQKVDLEFSESEKNFIGQHHTLSVAVLENATPFSSMDRDGTARGIIPDYYRRLAALTGLHFRFRGYANQHEVMQAITTGDADIIGLAESNVFTAEKTGLILSKSFDSMDMVLVTTSERKDPRTLAVPEYVDMSIADTFHKLSPDKKLLTFANVMDCYEAMQDGRVDAIICALPAATWLLNQRQSVGYSITSMSRYNWEACGVVTARTPILRSILNKGIEASGSDIEGIIATNTLQENSLRSLVSKIPVLWIYAFALILLFMVIILAVSVIVLVRHHRERRILDAINAENRRKESELALIEKSHEEKEVFFSTISHDMRTPLNAIIGFSSLAQEEPLPPVVADYVENIRVSGNLLLDLINDTLTISKMNSGKLELHPEPVSLEGLFDSILIPVRAAAEKKDITLSEDFSGMTVGNVMADSLNTRKIILNLLSNAVKYTRSGGHVSFRVWTETTERGADTLITVRDDGIGISDAFLGHIYEPFIQEQRKGFESGGTGLGLAIVKRLVDMMGGTISVQSHLNAGTTFTVRLHLESVKTLPEQHEAPAAKSAERLALLQGKRVLVCEDNQLNLRIANALLKKNGVVMVAATNGQEGLDIFSQSAENTFAAILMDIRMPVMDGYDATRAIRALHRKDAGTVPIIAMTADTYENDIRKCHEAGMNLHLAKPIIPEKLVAALLRSIA